MSALFVYGSGADGHAPAISRTNVTIFSFGTQRGGTGLGDGRVQLLPLGMVTLGPRETQ